MPDLPPLAPIIPAQPPVPAITTVQQHVAIRPPLFTSPYMEHRQLFGRRRVHPYSGHGNIRQRVEQKWCQKFYCLATCRAENVPMSKAQKQALEASSLGEKKVEVPLNSTPDGLHRMILATFPALQLCGGYQLCRAASSKRLEVIQSPPTGHTPLTLADVIGQSRVYIRPLQRDISLAGCSSQSLEHSSDVSGDKSSASLLHLQFGLICIN